MVCLGFTPAQINGLTLWDVKDLNAYWEEIPPINVLVASYLGAVKQKPKAATPAKLKELAQAFGLAEKEG